MRRRDGLCEHGTANAENSATAKIQKVLLEAAGKKGYIEAGTQDDGGQLQFEYILYMERTMHGSAA